MAKKPAKKEYQETISARPGTKDKIAKLIELVCKDTPDGVTVSGAAVIEIALNEAIASRKGKK